MWLSFKIRIFPWQCASGFLRRIVPDAAPSHGLMEGKNKEQCCFWLFLWHNY